jgi:hypothetical protein
MSQLIAVENNSSDVKGLTKDITIVAKNKMRRGMN